VVQSGDSGTRAAAGSEGAGSGSFENRVLEHRGRLLKVAYLMLGHREDAEDATQRALLKALGARGRFRGDSQLYTWLYRILVNQCKDRYKSRGRAQRTFVEMPPEAEAMAASSAPSAQELLEEAEQSQLVRRAIAQLPPRLREILVLRHYEELPYDEIARVLGCPVGTVRSRLSKAREEVRALIERERRMSQERESRP
jgi:RNA polymerase sigma-70 factor (ECF subfamily)